MIIARVVAYHVCRKRGDCRGDCLDANLQLHALGKEADPQSDDFRPAVAVKVCFTTCIPSQHQSKAVITTGLPSEALKRYGKGVIMRFFPSVCVSMTMSFDFAVHFVLHLQATLQLMMDSLSTLLKVSVQINIE